MTFVAPLDMDPGPDVFFWQKSYYESGLTPRILLALWKVFLLEEEECRVVQHLPSLPHLQF